ncbi:MAG: 4-hydroxy-tetrahydrodipicolinate reductase [bacterium]
MQSIKNIDFIGFTGKTGSIIFEYLKNKYHFSNLINSQNSKDYIPADNTLIIDFSTKNFLLQLLERIQNRHYCKLVYVTGVTGFSFEEFQKIDQVFRTVNISGYHLPNFSVGINLINMFVGKVAKYFNECEIIEMHHKTKKDKPSGTSILTSNNILQTWKEKGMSNKVNIHSVRLPSLVAHQTVIFANDLGEVIEITHHSFSRQSFAYGVYLLVDKILNGNEYHVGLKYNLNLLDLLELDISSFIQ